MLAANKPEEVTTVALFILVMILLPSRGVTSKSHDFLSVSSLKSMVSFCQFGACLLRKDFKSIGSPN